MGTMVWKKEYEGENTFNVVEVNEPIRSMLNVNPRLSALESFDVLRTVM